MNKNFCKKCKWSIIPTERCFLETVKNLGCRFEKRKYWKFWEYLFEPDY